MATVASGLSCGAAGWQTEEKFHCGGEQFEHQEFSPGRFWESLFVGGSGGNGGISTGFAFGQTGGSCRHFSTGFAFGQAGGTVATFHPASPLDRPEAAVATLFLRRVDIVVRQLSLPRVQHLQRRQRSQFIGV